MLIPSYTMVLPYFGWLHVYPLPSASIQSQHEVLPKAARYGDAAAWRLGNCFFCLRRNTALKCCSARCPHPAATLQGEFTTARLKFFPVAYRFRAQTYISTHCATHILIKTSTQRIQWQVHGRSGKHRQARFDAAEKRHVGLYRHIRHTHDIACVRLFWSHLQPLNNCDMQYSVRASPPKHPPNTNTLCLG